MKRIVFLSLGMLLLVSGTAEARGRRSNVTYTQPARVAPAAITSLPTSATPTAAAGYSTATAQGVANIMAASNRVGHFGGNTGYEGCGMASTPQAAYNICCYANSGLTTVDVGYAQSASGMWYCCRRYR